MTTKVLNIPHVILIISAIADALICAAYFAIPIEILAFKIKYKLNIRPVAIILWLFIGFIALCGISHGVTIYSIAHDQWVVLTVVKVLTAIISVITSLAMLKVIPMIVHVKIAADRQHARLNLLETLRAATFAIKSQTNELDLVNETCNQIEQCIPEISKCETHTDSEAVYVEQITINDEYTIYISSYIQLSESSQDLMNQILVICQAEFAKINKNRHLSEQNELLQAIFYSSAHPMIITSGKGVISQVNNATNRVFGYTSEELIDEPISMLVPLDNIIQSQNIGRNLTVKGRTKTGKIINLSLGLGRCEYEHTLFYVATLTDLTELQSVQTAEMRKTQFIENISHEIRTPLNGIMGMLGILRNGDLNNTQKSYVDTCLQNSESLLSILNNILSMSQLEAGVLSIVKEEISLDAVVENAIQILCTDKNIGNVDIYYSIELGCPHYIRSDRAKIFQILVNLISNAIKFTEQGHIYIRVRTDANSQILCFDVIDTGIGISKDDIQLLFKRFSRVTSDTQSISGTGLGLAICKKYAEILKGDISVTSEKGSGSKFTFTMPYTVVKTNRLFELSDEQLAFLRKQTIYICDNHPIRSQMLIDTCKILGCNYIEDQIPQNDDNTILLIDVDSMPNTGTPPKTYVFVSRKQMQQQMPAVKIMKPILRTSLLHRISTEYKKSTIRVDKTVLIVDDNQTNVEVLEVILKQAGYKTLTAYNGIESMKLYKKADLVLMDISMPKMDGITATKIIKETFKPCVVMVTANSTIEAKRNSLAAGARAIIFKPIDVDKMVCMVDHILQKPVSILLVDDNEQILKTQTMVIKDIANNAEVCTASTETEALHLISSKFIDLVFMDVNLGKDNGIEIVKKIRDPENHFYQPYIVGLSGYSGEISHRCLNAGMNDYKEKPLLYEDVKKIINAQVYKYYP